MNKRTIVLLTFILILAAFLRLYMLGINPPSLDWDEASLGYNAFSLLKTGKDEFGRAWPVSIRSFEDFKPALYTYLAIPSVALFGLSEYAVRFPSAFIGILTVIAVYLLTQIMVDLSGISNNHGKKISLITTLLFSVSPWHLQFSRVAFESNLGLFFVVVGSWLFLKGLETGKWFIGSTVLYALSFYAYHSPRLVVPMLLFGWIVFYWYKIRSQYKWIAISTCLGLLLLIPFFKETLSVGKARFSSVTVLSPYGRIEDTIRRIDYDNMYGSVWGRILHNRRIIYTFAIAKGYLDHFNLDFLFLTGDGPDRHHARDIGMLYIWEAPFILIGLLFWLTRKKGFLIFWWFLVAPAASALTTGTPHAVRALYYLPMYQIFAANGLTQFWLRFVKFKPRIVAYIVLAFATINIFYYLDMYYVHTPIEASKDWQYGYKLAVAEIKNLESQVDKVIVTYAYDQPHIFVLFYNKIDPAWYQSKVNSTDVKRDKRSFGKYEFRIIDWNKDKDLTSVIIVGTPGEIPVDAPGFIKDIHFLDGTVAFRIVKR